MKLPEADPKTLFELDATLEAAREKYRLERDKRLRADGSAQFRELMREGAHSDLDPYADPEFTRPSVEEDVEVLIVGGGFGGLLMSVRLREAGIEDFRIVEAAGDFGGTWYWNRYPGVQCDVESYVYMPLLEEIGTIPSEKYAHGPEIFAHAQAIGRHYDLYADALFQTQVNGLAWDEGETQMDRLHGSRRSPSSPLRRHGERALFEAQAPGYSGPWATSKGTRFTRVGGTTNTPAAIRPGA